MMQHAIVRDGKAIHGSQPLITEQPQFRGIRSAPNNPGEIPRSRYSDASDAAIEAWIVGLHVSACLRWLQAEPIPVREVEATMAVIRATMKALGSEVGGFSFACASADGWDLETADPQRLLDVLSRVRVRLGRL